MRRKKKKKKNSSCSRSFLRKIAQVEKTKRSQHTHAEIQWQTELLSTTITTTTERGAGLQTLVSLCSHHQWEGSMSSHRFKMGPEGWKRKRGVERKLPEGRREVFICWRWPADCPSSCGARCCGCTGCGLGWKGRDCAPRRGCGSPSAGTWDLSAGDKTR